MLGRFGKQWRKQGEKKRKMVQGHISIDRQLLNQKVMNALIRNEGSKIKPVSMTHHVINIFLLLNTESNRQ